MSDVEELAKMSGKSKVAIYDLCKKLGRLPTLEEVKAVKVGRPPKYTKGEKWKMIRIWYLCKRIGIETLADLEKFSMQEKRADEDLVDCLERYYQEIGGENFRIINKWGMWNENNRY